MTEQLITTVLFLLLLAIGCGSQTDREYQCDAKGSNCDRVDKQTGTSSQSSNNAGNSVGSQGPRGEQGDPGKDSNVAGPVGPTGASGSSCTVVQAVNGALITCGTDSVLVLNGTDGQQGRAGEAAPPTAYTVVGIVDPCGDASGIFDEVFLRLENGTLVASFSDNASGSNTRFSILVPGSYITTDGSHCYFTIDNQLQLINEHY